MSIESIRQFLSFFLSDPLKLMDWIMNCHLQVSPQRLFLSIAWVTQENALILKPFNFSLRCALWIKFSSMTSLYVFIPPSHNSDHFFSTGMASI